MPDNLFPEEYDNDEEYLDDEENEGTDEENTEEDEDAGYKPSIFFEDMLMRDIPPTLGLTMKVPCKQIAVKRQKVFYKERLKRR